jgi:glycosyltransferase involved in cell wall biosynthesis
MKLIFANNYYYLRGGSEHVFFDEMEILSSCGHKVLPFTRHFEKNIPSEYSRFFPPAMYYDDVSSIKKFVSAFKLIYSLETKAKFSELLEYAKPDVVHFHNIYGRLTSSIIDSAKSKKIPAVMTLHDYKLICPSYLMLLNGKRCERCKGGKFYNSLFMYCHKNNFLASAVYTIESYFNLWFKKYDWIRFFICPSMFSLKKHLEAGIPEEKLVHIPNFIKVKNFEPDYEPGDYILFVGRLSQEKGVLTLLKAVKGLDIELKIVGDGPIRKEYEKYVRNEGMINVTFEGYKSGEELKSLYKNSAFVILPSEWYEVFGLIAVEASAYGKLVIGSSIGAIPEIIINEKTGLLFEPGDNNGLREKMKYLLSNPSLITRMGKDARKRAEEEYNPELHYKRLMEVYGKAMAGERFSL